MTPFFLITNLITEFEKHGQHGQYGKGMVNGHVPLRLRKLLILQVVTTLGYSQPITQRS